MGFRRKGGDWRVGKGMVISVGLSPTEEIRPAAASSQGCVLFWACFFLAAPGMAWILSTTVRLPFLTEFTKMPPTRRTAVLMSPCDLLAMRILDISFYFSSNVRHCLVSCISQGICCI